MQGAPWDIFLVLPFLLLHAVSLSMDFLQLLLTFLLAVDPILENLSLALTLLEKSVLDIPSTFSPTPFYRPILCPFTLTSRDVSTT